MRSSPEPVFDAGSLKRIEHVYRRQLAEDPSDSLARISLAWCLFMQALLRAGEERVLQSLVQEPDADDEAPLSLSPLTQHDATELLADCLRQTMTVKQLSANPAANLSAERLLALVKLSGNTPALNAAEDVAGRTLNQMTRAVLGTGGIRRMSGLRRLPTRKAS